MLFAILITLTRLALPYFNAHHQFFERWLSEAIHRPIKIEKIDLTWHGFSPRFHFKKVAIYKGKRPVPSAVVLGVLGLTFSGWILKRRKAI